MLKKVACMRGICSIRQHKNVRTVTTTGHDKMAGLWNKHGCLAHTCTL